MYLQAYIIINVSNDNIWDCIDGNKRWEYLMEINDRMQQYLCVRFNVTTVFDFNYHNFVWIYSRKIYHPHPFFLNWTADWIISLTSTDWMIPIKTYQSLPFSLISIDIWSHNELQNVSIIQANESHWDLR